MFHITYMKRGEEAYKQKKKKKLLLRLRMGLDAGTVLTNCIHSSVSERSSRIPQNQHMCLCARVLLPEQFFFFQL